MLTSAPRLGGGAAHQAGGKRAAEAAEKCGAAALRVAEQEEVGEQAVSEHSVHGFASHPCKCDRFSPVFMRAEKLYRLGWS